MDIRTAQHTKPKVEHRDGRHLLIHFVNISSPGRIILCVTFKMRYSKKKKKLSCVQKSNNENCVLSFPYLEADKLQFIDIQLGKTPIGKS